MYTGWFVWRVCSNLQFATSHREKGTGSRRGVEDLKSLYRSWGCTFDDRTPSTQMVPDAHTPPPLKVREIVHIARLIASGAPDIVLSHSGYT